MSTPSFAPIETSTAAPLADGVEVLVADDHDDTRCILREYLQAHGYRVREARDGQEAIRELERVCPSAMVLDVRMPKMDGLEVLRAVRAKAGLCRLPILCLSAHALPEEVREIEAAGTDAYLAKPVEPRAVLVALQALLAEARSPEAARSREPQPPLRPPGSRPDGAFRSDAWPDAPSRVAADRETDRETDSRP